MLAKAQPVGYAECMNWQSGKAFTPLLLDNEQTDSVSTALECTMEGNEESRVRKVAGLAFGCSLQSDHYPLTKLKTKY